MFSGILVRFARCITGSFLCAFQGRRHGGKGSCCGATTLLALRGELKQLGPNCTTLGCALRGEQLGPNCTTLLAHWRYPVAVCACGGAQTIGEANNSAGLRWALR